MIKYLIILSICGLSILTSCKKSYTCTCTFTMDSVIQHVSMPLKETQKDAEEICNAQQQKYAAYPDVNCELSQ